MRIQGTNNTLTALMIFPTLAFVGVLKRGEDVLSISIGILIGFSLVLLLFGFSLIIRYVEFSDKDVIVKYLFRKKVLDNELFDVVQIRKSGFIFRDELGRPMMQISKAAIGNKCYIEIKEKIKDIYQTEII